MVLDVPRNQYIYPAFAVLPPCYVGARLALLPKGSGRGKPAEDSIRNLAGFIAGALGQSLEILFC